MGDDYSSVDEEMGLEDLCPSDGSSKKQTASEGGVDGSDETSAGDSDDIPELWKEAIQV